MRIGTWNVERATGQAKNARRRAVLEAQACDLWVLTETHDELVPSEAHVAVPSAPHPAGRLGERWVTIWSRYPVLEPLAVADPRRTVAALIQAPTGPLIVVGTVLPWATDRGDAAPGTVVRGWSELHRVVPEQGAEWAALRRRYPEAALCVAGDLNMNIGGRHFYGTAQARTLLSEAMAGAGLFCATSADCIPEGALEHPLIDHVLLPIEWQPHMRFEAAWEGKAGPGPRLSDHSGVAVSINLTPLPSPS